MPKAKADYKHVTQQLVARLEDAGLDRCAVARLNNELAALPDAEDADLGRVLRWFRVGKVPGWTMIEAKGQPLMHRIVAKATSVPTVTMPEQAQATVDATKFREPDFGPDVVKFIPARTPEMRYHPRDIGDGKTDIQILERAWQERRSVLLYGKPGSGKSTAPWVLAQKLGLPVVRISMDETKDASKILGQWVPADGGGFRFMRAPALTMYEQGGVLVVEELNAITPGVAFTLHPMLDDLDVMVVDDLGVVARRHPDFWVVATMNPSEDVGATGTQQVNYALWDRFKCKLFYDYDREVEAMLVKNDPRILSIRDRLRGSDKLRTEVTTRMLRDFWQNVQIFGWPVAKVMFVANFPASEREVAAETCKLIGG